MRANIASKIPILVGGLAYLLFAYLSSFARDTDSVWPLLKWIAVLVQALFLWGSIWGWGIFVQKTLRIEGKALALPFGTLWLCGVTLLLAILGVAGPKWSALWVVFALCGFYFIPKLPRFAWDASDLGPLLLFFLLTLLALAPQAHPDPLFYHLLAVRRWYDHGGMHFFNEHPLLFLSGLWDMLYLFALQLETLAPGENLISQQLVAQLLHLWVGCGGTFLLLVQLFTKLNFSRAKLWALFLLLNLFFFPVAIVAKNDWGLLLWASAGLLLLQERQKKLIFWGAFCLGAAVSNKWSSACGIFSIYAWLFWREWGNPDRLRAAAFGGIVGALGIILRNFVFTKDPFFPLLLNSLNPNLLSPTDTILFQAYADAWKYWSFGIWVQKLWVLFTSHPLCLGILILPLVVRAEKRVTNWTGFVLFLLMGILAASFLLHPALSWRITEIFPLFLPLGVVLALRKYAEDLDTRLLALGILGFFLFLNWNKFTELTRVFEQPAARIREFPAGDAMAWLRLQKLNKEKIAFGGNAELYYSSALLAVDLDTFREIDYRLSQVNKFQEFLKILRAENFHYFVETNGDLPRGRSAGFFAKLAQENHTQAIVFEGRYGRIWDLTQLEKWMNSSDFRDFTYDYKGFVIEAQK